MFFEKIETKSEITFKQSYVIEGMNNLLQTINNIENPKNFIFFIDNKKIKCNRLIASFISPLIAKSFQIDRTTWSFAFHSDEFSKIIETYHNLILNMPTNSPESQIDFPSEYDLKKMIQKKLYEILKKTCQCEIEDYIIFQLNEKQQKTSIIEILILLKLFNDLGNSIFVQIINENLKEYLKIANLEEKNIENDVDLIERLRLKEICGIDPTNEIEYVKNHFIEIDTDMLNEMKEEIIEKAISKEDFQIQDEDSFLFQILQMKDDFRYRFLPFVHFEFITEKVMKVFLEEVTFSDINIEIWNSLSTRLLTPLNEDSISELKTKSKRFLEPLIFEFKENQFFNGIFNYLNNKCGGNSHLKGLIEISSSEELENHSYNLIDKDFQSCFCTNNGWNTFIQFDFKDFKVSIEKYCYKTIGIPTAKFIDWEIVGSNDQEKWDTITRRHINAWPGSNDVSIYKNEKSNFYRYIKIKMTGYNASGDFNLYLSSVEFFGTIKINKRNKYNVGW